MPLPFISLLFGKAKWLLLAAVVAAACWGYWTWSRAEIAALHNEVTLVRAQADALAAANDHIRADIAIVQRNLDRANRSMADARSRAAQAGQAIRNQNLGDAARARPKDVEAQINGNTADTFKQFEDATRAP